MAPSPAAADPGSLSRISDNYIVHSPYNESSHLLDLSTLSQPIRLAALALQTLNPVISDPSDPLRFVTLPYAAAFNWDEVLADLRRRIASEGGNYVFPRTELVAVAFRSRRSGTADVQELGRLDKAAHEEAVAGGGLLK